MVDPIDDEDITARAADGTSRRYAEPRNGREGCETIPRPSSSPLDCFRRLGIMLDQPICPSSLSACSKPDQRAVLVGIIRDRDASEADAAMDPARLGLFHHGTCLVFVMRVGAFEGLAGMCRDRRAQAETQCHRGS